MESTPAIQKALHFKEQFHVKRGGGDGPRQPRPQTQQSWLTPSHLVNLMISYYMLLRYMSILKKICWTSFCGNLYLNLNGKKKYVIILIN